MPQPSVKRMGRKPATKLESLRPSASSSTSLRGGVGPEERHDRVHHRELDVLAARCRARGRRARR